MIQDRRDFLKKSTYSTLLGLVIPNIPFAKSSPTILSPVEGGLPDWKNKELIILSDKPWNVETPPHLLDDKVTPVEKMFIRNNGLVPEGNIDVNTWTLTIGGESVKTSKTYKLKDLKEKFKHYTYQLTLECGGNGRSGYFPQTSGNQWDQGAVSCAEWTGVRLKDILADVGLKDDAVYIGYYGKDIHLSRTPNKSVISRGVPIKKALEDETLIAWAVNGKDIPLEHGFPLRLVIGGWPASVSGKWLDKIVVRNKEHDGEKMSGHSYRVPINPIEPGEKLAETPENFKIIEAMPVKSLITYPKTGAVIDTGKTITLRGHAWAGDLAVKEVAVSLDYGVSWKKCNLEAPKNRLAWQHWSLALDFSQKGYFEVWVKATDSKGITQPMVIPQWNPGGYLNNACHRIAVKVV
ncbi:MULTISPECIES: sulfite oxidase [unclassified Arcicella]|uniref:sulfite oxidase n=1 Tax=unclassified Arcicella TaxID=2644986 RepID=UPI00285EE88F|nr:MULTISPECIES: sulfite oxidase [unclassified Arcicella]MDR6560881.1 DMSO/TMAO reductase YedYZ molybdopterin-dependent catalytic subunit [Arcicella sp. BE51]MDR6810765.1 DMSO/TMAO reductase YedYZ molybdopterin-dependent catalytic subunit [Arcicella sp. BE140]MDR6822115.1 DMSO/TMAO reductase YedYZ molybdopterin-dependent catalytic subunit [Arcicella sp. BE139]